MNKHISERGLGGPGGIDPRPGAAMLRGTRCYCFSSSESKTSSADQRAVATDQARAQSGSGNVQAEGKARVQQVSGNRGPVAGGDKSVAIGGSLVVDSSNKISGSGNTVTIDNGSKAVEQVTNTFAGLVGNLSSQNSEALKSLVDAQTSANELLTHQLTTTPPPGTKAPGDTPTDTTSLLDKLKAWWTGKTDDQKKNLKLLAAGIALALAAWWFLRKKS